MGDYGHDLEFGTFVTPAAADPQATVRLAVHTELTAAGGSIDPSP